MSKGYGFLRFGSQDQAQTAINELQGTYLLSRPLKLNYAAQKRSQMDAQNSRTMPNITGGMGLSQGSYGNMNLPPPGQAGQNNQMNQQQHSGNQNQFMQQQSQQQYFGQPPPTGQYNGAPPAYNQIPTFPPPPGLDQYGYSYPPGYGAPYGQAPPQGYYGGPPPGMQGNIPSNIPLPYPHGSIPTYQGGQYENMGPQGFPNASPISPTMPQAEQALPKYSPTISKTEVNGANGQMQAKPFSELVKVNTADTSAIGNTVTDSNAAFGVSSSSPVTWAGTASAQQQKQEEAAAEGVEKEVVSPTHQLGGQQKADQMQQNIPSPTSGGHALGLTSNPEQRVSPALPNTKGLVPPPAYTQQLAGNQFMMPPPDMNMQAMFGQFGAPPQQSGYDQHQQVSQQQFNYAPPYQPHESTQVQTIPKAPILNQLITGSGIKKRNSQLCLPSEQIDELNRQFLNEQLSDPEVLQFISLSSFDSTSM